MKDSFSYMHFEFMRKKALYFSILSYKASNKKQFLEFIVKYNRCLEALRRSALEKDGYSPSIGKNTTLDMVCHY